MIHIQRLAPAALALTMCLVTSWASAREQAILYQLGHHGTMAGSPLGLTKEQQQRLTGLGQDYSHAVTHAERQMEREFQVIQDQDGLDAWRAKYGALQRQVNHEMWAEVETIIPDPDTRKTYFRSVLQSSLLANQPHAVASLLGREPSWLQLEACRTQMEACHAAVEQRVAKVRHQLDRKILGDHVADAQWAELLGETFVWKLHQHGRRPIRMHFVPMGLGVHPSDLSGQVACLPEVQEHLKLPKKARAAINELFGADEDDPFGGYGGYGGFGGPDDSVEEALASKREQEAEWDRQLLQHMTPDQHKRLKQLAVQFTLHHFNYGQFLCMVLDDNQLAKLLEDREVTNKWQRDLQKASGEARMECEFVRQQAKVDLYAKAVDNELASQLAESVGELVAHWGQHRVTNDGSVQPLPEKLARHRSPAATVELTIPQSLVHPPLERVEWNTWAVPDGWGLAEAEANLQEVVAKAEQIQKAYRDWQRKSRGRRRGRGRDHFDVRRQFDGALSLVGEDLNKARQIVRKLGGAPGPLKNYRSWR